MENNELVWLEQYDIFISPINDENEFNGFKKISGEDFAKLNACFRDVSYFLKNINDSRYYTSTYKVIYDKGLGALQKSAKNPELFRANIVANGTNNSITGQALLQESKPSELMVTSNLLLSAFSVAAVVTNQYYLSRIDNKLEDVEKKVDEILRFIEIEQQSKLWADGEIVKQIRNNLEYIANDNVYRQTTLVTIQSIRRNALSNIKLFHEQLRDLKEFLNIKDNNKDAMKNLNKYISYLPKFWYATYLFEISYYLEAYLSQVTDERFLNNIAHEMLSIIQMFDDGYEVIDKEFNKYIDEVKALKANEVPTKIMKEVGKALAIASFPGYNPLVVLGAKGLGVALDAGGEYLEKAEISKKKIRKQEFIQSLENLIRPYADLETLNFNVEAVNMLNSIYNKHFELIVSENEAFVKLSTDDNL